MLGKPKYKVGDKVSFKLDDEIITGTIVIVDAYGTFFDDSDVSYDIESKELNIWFKHVREDYILED